MIELSDKKVLFCDLDGTLVRTVSGRPFPADVTDWCFRKDVLDAIAAMPGLVSLSVVSNQGGIPRYVRPNDFYSKMVAVRAFLRHYFNIKVYYEYCTSNDRMHPMRKPNPGMLEKIARENYGSYEKYEMLMVGQGDGNRFCAMNFGVDFMEVDDFINQLKQ